MVVDGSGGSPPCSAAAQQIQVYNNASPEKLVTRQVCVPGGKTLDLAVGIGSSLYHMPGDPADRFWALSDRGPNIACSDAEDIMGVDPKKFCSGIKQGRIYPRPDYAPSIFEVQLDRAKGTFSVVDTIRIKRADGTPVTGLPNPLTKATTETPLDGNGKPLATDPAALDTEALVRLPDGTFWIGEENAPSILHVAADGKVLRRFVPQGSEADFAAAGYPVAGTLPAILTKRQLNRGIESLALDADGFLWAVLQNPWPIPMPMPSRRPPTPGCSRSTPPPAARWPSMSTRWSRWKFPRRDQEGPEHGQDQRARLCRRHQVPDRRSDR